MSISLNEAKNFGSYLEKKSNKTFGGYQKRYFRILEGGNYIAYYDKEKDDLNKPKGRIPVDTIKSLQKKEDKKFRIMVKNDERIYHLKAKTKELRDNWVTALELILASKQPKETKETNEIKETNDTNETKESNEQNEQSEPSEPERSSSLNLGNQEVTEERVEKDDDKEQIIPLEERSISISSNISNSTMPITKKQEKIEKKNNSKKSKYMKLDTKLLEKKGIVNLLQLSNPEIKKRFYSGVLKTDKNLKEMEFHKKTYWALLFSSRPLRNADYEKDDKMLDNTKLKEWLKYDTLFFFNPEDEYEIEPNISLDLKECHSIACEEKSGKYFISIAVGDNNYLFYNKIQEERDLAFEVIKNSRRTAKDIANSITKRPRNMVRLLNLYEKKGKQEYLDDLEKEENKKLGNFLKIQDFDTLLFVLRELDKMVSETLDGCLLIHKDNSTIFEISVDHYIALYLKIISSFWEANYNRLDNEKIMKMSNILFDFENLLKKFRVEDQNISKNANEFVKIYIKKIYKQLLEFIQNILKSERELKQVQNSKKEYITNGPNDLFTMLSNIISANKNVKISYIHTYILNMIYEGIIQFLIGTDCITSNYNLQVEPEYLLAIANNTVEFIPLLNNFIDKYEEGCILSEKRIHDEIHMKSILTSLNLLRKNTIIRFVTQLSQPLAEGFKCYYHLLDLTKVIDITSDVYFKYNTFMNDLVKKRIWEEILKLTIYYYMKVLITTSTKGIQSSEELIKKLMEDKNLIKDQYSLIVGDNLTLLNLKIFDDLITFLQNDPVSLPNSCMPLRAFCGPSFNIDTVSNLLVFRKDISKDELKEVLEECKKSLNNYREENYKDSFFEDMEKNAERRISIKERMAKKNKDGEKKMDEEMGELETNLYKFEDFVDEDNDEKDNNDNSINESNIDNNNIINENEKVTDVIMEGKMKKKKKGNKKYQERYFQIKSGYLYWFLNENSRSVQKKINIKNIIKIETKGANKIIIVVEDPNEKEAGGSIYKLLTENENSKLAWVKAITDEMKKIVGENKNKNNAVYKTELKKKSVVDMLQLPDIGTERTKIKLEIIEQIKKEGYFKFIEEEKVKNTDNIDTKKEKENENEEKPDNYDPHEALFNEGKLKQYDIPLEETKEKKGEESGGIGGMFANCCQSFLNLFSKKNTSSDKPS